MKRETIVAELDRIARNNGGVLKAEDVVAEAEPEDHPLHECFEWDDETCGREYRLWQARQLIRTTVVVLPHAERRFRAYVSLMNDRKEEGGGYRMTVGVLSDSDMRERLLVEALAELEVIRDKYKTLKELAPIFEAMDGVRNGRRRKRA